MTTGTDRFDPLHQNEEKTKFQVFFDAKMEMTVHAEKKAARVKERPMLWILLT